MGISLSPRSHMLTMRFGVLDPDLHIIHHVQISLKVKSADLAHASDVSLCALHCNTKLSLFLLGHSLDPGVLDHTTKLRLCSREADAAHQSRCASRKLCNHDSFAVYSFSLNAEIIQSLACS